MSGDNFTFSGGFVDITPTTLMPLAGYGKQRGVARSIVDRLEANAIVLRRSSTAIAFVQVDAISAGQELRRRIIDGLRGALREEELFLAASHTHFAPGIDPRIPDIGFGPSRHVDWVAERIVAMLRSVLAQEGRPSRLYYGESQAAHSVNRRRLCLVPRLGIPPVKRRIALRPNAAGTTDETVRVFGVADSLDGTSLMGALWNYACHPVASCDFRGISAAYPGAVRRILRQRFGERLPVVFLLGFCGDVRPNVVKKFAFSPYYLFDRLVNGPAFRRFTRRSWDRWTESLGRVVVDALTGRRLDLEAADLRVGRYSEPLQNLMNGQVDDRPLTYQYVAFGDACLLVGMSAEVVADYVEKVKGLFPGRRVVPVSCLDGTCCYIPTPEMLVEGGVEARSTGYSLENAAHRAEISELVLRRMQMLVQGDLEGSPP